MTRQSDAQLGIDLGTTHTVAALTSADGRSQPLLFDASFLLPSAVFAEADGHLLTGKDAERSARLDPSRFEPNPKRRVDDGSVLLGNREYQVSDLLASLLRRTADEASRVLGIMPVRTVLTYPANWATHRRAVLADAAARAGMPSPILVPEPVAAASYFTSILGRQIPPGGVLVVYDFGGGTFDTTVMRRRPDGGWDVLASDGLPDVVGVDLDAALTVQIGQTLAQTDADRWRQLTDPGDDAARRRSHLLREDVRTAKEQLSRTSSAGVHVPLFETDLHVTRAEFEQVSRPYLQRTVDLTAGTLQRAGVRPDQISGLFLVGGSSRIPLVSTLLHQRLGVAPTIIEQPELVVALGAALAAMPSRPMPPGPPRGPMPPAGPRPPGMGAPPMAAGMAGPNMTAPMGMPPGPASPISGAAGPVSPVSGPAGPISPAAAPPVSAPPTWVNGIPPAHGAPVSAPPGNAPAGFGQGGVPGNASSFPPGPPGLLSPPNTQTAQFGHGGAPNSGPPFGPPPASKSSSSGSKLAVVLGVAIVAVLLLGAGGVAAWKAVSKDDSVDKPTTTSSSRKPGGGGSDTSAGPAAPANTKDAKPGAEQQTVDIGKSVWYGQTKITFGKLTYDKSAEDPLVVAVQVENLGDDGFQAYALRIVYMLDGQEYKGSVQENATVSGGQKSNWTVAFSVYDPLKSSIAGGTILMGAGDEAQVKLPLGGGDANVYEPVNLLKDKKSPAVNNLEATYTTCDLRGGFLDFNGQAKKDYRVLTCKVDLRFTGTGSLYVGSNQFRLGLPDGTEVSPTTAPNEAMRAGGLAPATNLGYQFKYQPGTYKLRVVVVKGDTRAPTDVAEVDVVVK